MLFLTEADVIDLLPMEAALACVEGSLRAQGEGAAVNRPRQRIFLPGVSLHYMAAVLPGSNLLGVKVYTVSRGAVRFVVLLYDAERGELLAMIEADQMGRIRTGAASGMATQLLSRADSSTVAVIGAGRQARTQLQAVSLVRKLQSVRVFSRDAGHRRQFCGEASAQLGLEVEPAESAEAAARSADIVITATTSREPVVRGEWLRPGAHVNAIGVNMPDRREMDDALMRRAALIAVDSLEQCRVEAGDLIQAFAHEPALWDRVFELGEIVAGRKPGRQSPEEITIFKSTGLALWDVAAAGEVLRRAREAGRGTEIALSATVP
ncbi:MAG: ornithine cyclodeaminase family protein [Terriglobia bacterium]